MNLSTTMASNTSPDGVDARTRLLDAALQLFAENGFAKTSIRAIAQQALTNVSAISYYFGDKVGLYRALFADPRTNPRLPLDALDGPGVPLVQTLRTLLASFLEPMKQEDERQRLYTRLCLQEMLSPTGAWQQEIDEHIAPAHLALVRALGRHMGGLPADDDLHRLAFTITGLGVMLHVSVDLHLQLRPSLITAAGALDGYLDHLVLSAQALVEAEMQRRRQVPPQPLSNP